MNAFPEPGRQVAHIMLDAVATVGFAGRYSANSDAANLAWQRINEIPGAVDVAITGEESDVTSVQVDLSNVLGAAMITISRAVHLLAQRTDVDPYLVIAELREYVDL